MRFVLRGGAGKGVNRRGGGGKPASGRVWGRTEKKEGKGEGEGALERVFF